MKITLMLTEEQFKPTKDFLTLNRDRKNGFRIHLGTFIIRK
ncbi:hypothetical protein [Bacillus cereus]|nr:hypothetical protein [Bacillus cereus]